MESGIERLTIRHGETPTARHLRQLDAAIARCARLGGRGVAQRVWPWGTSSVFRGSGGGGAGSAPVFEPAVSILSADVAEVRWEGPRALIGGVAPVLEGSEIFTEDLDTGLRPAITVTREQFSAEGECGIYFRATLDHSEFRVLSVTPFASPVLPVRAPWEACKLALFLRVRNGAITYAEEDDRELFSSQGFFAVQRRTSGLCEPLWWAMF
jgi:hypothetical protein